MNCKICGKPIEKWQGRHNDFHSACESGKQPAPKPGDRPDWPRVPQQTVTREDAER